MLQATLLSQNPFCEIKQSSGCRKKTPSHLSGVHPACRMKIIAPQVNQTGEVRLLSKLLIQKVDTECCVRSREKTLTVQGLWVCKKTESSLKMHLQAAELLTFRYAYKTVLNRSKQKKGLEQCCVDGRSDPQYSLIYNSCQTAFYSRPGRTKRSFTSEK